MSFKLKYKPEDGPDLELDFEELVFTDDGHFILRAEDKTTGQWYEFEWLSRDVIRTRVPSGSLIQTSGMLKSS